ncbi:hypothetical protein LUZ61_013239 [Rhynchospora tenuis]|uniref:Receptor kinase-like protein Xa21 n=1 Tax=Rhynchospora tenuis TaxID=198213 RepID=A0AAD5W908_9POAL|nr:hypothetical protein LUZ61_013239 [Rhynchospora tenuis]
MAQKMEYCYHLLVIFILLNLSSFSIAATSKTDQTALLSFKSQVSSDPFGVLSSWNESVHHCQWQGVQCGQRHPDRVTTLILDSKQLSGYISPSLANLTFLKSLSLSDNQLQGSIPLELGYLGRLRLVNLTKNFFDGSIPSTLGNCSNLQVISLSFNNLQGSIPSSLGNCSNLQLLRLRSNHLHGTIPSNLVQCKKLFFIDMGKNFLIGGIPPELGTLFQLKYLSLFANNFTGSIPNTLGNLSSLATLYLDDNHFGGYIPNSLGKLTNLSELTITQNELIGSIPHSLGNLTNIVILNLYLNRLNGSIPDTIGNLQNLRNFYIYDNNISGKIPNSLFNLSSLVDLEVLRNKIEGTLPFDMCSALPNLKYLFLFSNQLNGKIPPSISNCSALMDIELQDNHFDGTIPSTMGTLQNLQYLLLNVNQLEAKTTYDWKFIDALTNCTSLQYLDIGYNLLQGVIPGSITKIISLGYLDMSNNMILGQIPSKLANLTRMDRLLLNDNALEGSIPDLSNMQVLELLNLSNNKLTGKIPKEIMGLPSLSNSLDLSHNYLTGILPPEIGKLKNLQSILLSNNKLYGQIPSTIDGCQVLQALYLDSNMFQGPIPSSLSNLKGLQKLDVSNNSFSGQVPEFMGRMNLQYLNISFNNFEGELPKEGIFKNVSGLGIRGNPKLCGGVPGLHLSQCISEPLTRKHHSPVNTVLIISVVGSLICLTIVVCIIATCYSRKRYGNKQESDKTLKYELKSVSYDELVRATENFSSSNLIGKGSFGAVYKANICFDNVKIVAVKVITLEKHGASRSFFSECEALRNVRHRNLIKVLSACSSIDHQGNDFKALVFEFMPNGSLATWLHPYMDQPSRSLSLVERLNIAIDVAQALDYLHNDGPTPIVHCDLKPSNVLLDDNMTAHVGDFGLARLLVMPDSIPSQSMTSIGAIKGSIGYIPPEYGMGARPSVEGDVYSYGILLLEMFTGISPTDEKLRDGVSLHKCVEMAFPTQVMDIADSKLFAEADGEAKTYTSEIVSGCLLSAIQCALMCSKELPKERIAIKDVVNQLNSARQKLLSL